MTGEPVAILWFRQDLRLEDNPALQAVSKQPFFAVYIWDEDDPWLPGGASRWWLYKSLNALKQSLRERGIQLVFKKGTPLDILKTLVQDTKASEIYWSRCYEPYARERDKEIKSYFKNRDIACHSFNGSLLVEPWEIQTKSKDSYQVFTPFWNALQRLSFPKPLSIPELKGIGTSVESDSREEGGLQPILWGKGLEETWQPGEKGAWKKLNLFMGKRIENYAHARDYPSEDVTSHLSPHLHWGEISSRKIWHLISGLHGPEALPFLRQLGWREFSYHLLFHFPDLPLKPLRSSFERFPWKENSETLKAWQKGNTGYPFVDAGMRELWYTGTLPNRVRMIVASFLVKHLLLPWQRGEEWFWDTLVDADLANNAVSWQWVAGCGADAAPYFRIFNPILQSEKFDPDGAYIKKWVPELKALEAPHIHFPSRASPEILKNSGIQLGITYPYPVVDHVFARKRALEAFKTL